ncbi:MAG: UDP-N-acetylmuramate--L-alanine ligase [Spirochaetaceae bacterium]|jgi:UDP-N-acetylmuramate--alanine ligase|nr:UDP-N-acetylmuramate--L-alanine ligase [Spirochaetaceae bacterium]
MALFEKGSRVYCVGIKGTGVSALAELLHAAGMRLSGSDTADVFYTDAVLRSLGIPYHESFAPEHIPADADVVIHSAAYAPETNCEMAEVVRRGLQVMKYTDALGAWSARFESAGIAGVHGKTTTTALAGALVRAAGLPAQVLAGSAVSSFGGRSTLNNGDKYFIAETCEYRRHFLSFRPKHIVITAVESDHQDYFPTYESIRDAFVEYALLLPEGGHLVYCADDQGAREVVELVKKEQRGIRFVPYGFSAEGKYRVSRYRVEAEKAYFDVEACAGSFTLSVPGKHNALNAAAALALIETLTETPANALSSGVLADGETLRRIKEGLDGFHGSKRRAEILGERDGVLFMDDYAHHPTAIAATIAGLKEFFPRRRLVVSFMSHTYTRTAALLDEFAASFEKADVVILHKIYASAREQYSGGVNGETLFEKTRALKKDGVFYVHEHEEAAPFVRSLLKPGDLFVTMGAGDNWTLGEHLFNAGREETLITENR